jgi:hypothetical protein
MGEGDNENMDTIFPKAAAQQKKDKADIVFCIDVTGSMQNCIDGIKTHIKRFVEGLQTSASIDYRLALIAYRDIHDETIPCGSTTRVCDEPWVIKNFTQDVQEFIKWLDLPDVKAYGGGDDPESTLDALYIAINKSDWRDQSHRVITLFTDDDTHPTLHPKTYRRPDNGIGRIIQDFQTLKHAILYMVVPRCQLYEALEKAGHSAQRKMIAKYVPNGDLGLKSVNFGELLKSIGSTVSASSLNLRESA